MVPIEASQCAVGDKWFAARSRSIKTAAIDFDQQATEIRKLLTNANAALITGIENLTTTAQQSAAKVADRYFTCIDSGWSNRGRGSMASFQRYGKVTATLGEVANRSDVVVLWFCDPMTTHPRFIERFVRNPAKPAKRLIVIDDNQSETAKIADQFIELSAAEALPFVQQLRVGLNDTHSEKQPDLLKTLTEAAYGSVFVGKPDQTDAAFDATTDQWFQLARSLNDHTRFVMASLRNDRNGIGANNVLTSLCGFPDAVRFTKSGPKYNGVEYSTASIVARRECDLLIVCDSGVDEPFENKLDADSVSWLKTIPVVVLSDFPANTYSSADIHVPVGVPGWTSAGDFVRTDDVPIPMTAASGKHIAGPEKLFAELLE
jgi:formylmethanofuran dehydrogenase subunit B